LRLCDRILAQTFDDRTLSRGEQKALGLVSAFSAEFERLWRRFGGK